jgi:hypothetical protein
LLTLPRLSSDADWVAVEVVAGWAVAADNAN